MTYVRVPTDESTRRVNGAQRGHITALNGKSATRQLKREALARQGHSARPDPMCPGLPYIAAPLLRVCLFTARCKVGTQT